MKVHIIGAGLVGRLLALRLSKLYNIVVYDSNKEQSGYSAAGFLLHHKWWLGNKKIIDLAKTHYGAYALGNGFYRIPPVSTLPFYPVRVINVEKKRDLVNYEPEDAIIWCVGSWAPEVDRLRFLYQDMQIKLGVAFTWLTGNLEETSFSFRFWAPFKSLCKIVSRGYAYATDGMAIKPENLTAERVAEAQARCEAPPEATLNYGRRPYTKTEGLVRIGEREYSINGAGKKGCMMAIDAIEKLIVQITGE